MSTSQNNGQIGPKVAILGHRGVPSNYGGFETLAEELTERLVGFGAQVTVYCRSNYFKVQPAEYKGARLVYLPTIEKQSLDTLVHSWLSVMHTIIKGTADVLVVVNVGNAPVALFAKLFRKKVVFCVDGLDWQRKKWGRVARWYLKACSYLAKLASHVVVTDAQSVHAFYSQFRGTDSALIPYGTDIETDYGTENILAEYNLTSKQYFIYVARFEPENNPLLVVEAHAKSGSTMPLVMIGDNRYNPAFVEQIKAKAAKNVLFLGYVFGSRYKQLVKNSLAFVRAAEVGGLAPTVIEAMGRGVCVIANDKPENREPLGETGLFYQLNTASLSAQFKYVTEHPKRALELGHKAAQRAMVLYSWDKIAYEYFKVIKQVIEPASALATSAVRLQATGRKKILITGAGGMLGEAVYNHFQDKYSVLATSMHPNEPWISALDVRDQVAYEKTVALFRPDYIFHLAAMTNLEACEKNLPEAYAINTLSVKYAAQAATKYGAKLLYISTSNVFSGTEKMYSDTDEPKPQNVYGLTKHMGALMAEYYARDYLTIRLGWLIGGGVRKDKKFVANIVQQILAGKKELHALTDKFGSVVYAPEVAKNIELLLQVGATGSYNFASSGLPSRYDIAREIVAILGYENSVTVKPVTNGFFQDTFSAPRPLSEGLLPTRLNKERLNILQPWPIVLADYLHTDFAFAFNTTSEKPSILVAITQ